MMGLTVSFPNLTRFSEGLPTPLRKSLCDHKESKSIGFTQIVPAYYFPCTFMDAHLLKSNGFIESTNIYFVRMALRIHNYVYDYNTTDTNIANL